MIRCGFSMLSEEEIELFHSTVRPLVTGHNMSGCRGEMKDIFVKIAYNGYTRRDEKKLSKKRKTSEPTVETREDLESQTDACIEAAEARGVSEINEAPLGTYERGILVLFESSLKEHVEQPARYNKSEKKWHCR